MSITITLAFALVMLPTTESLSRLGLTPMERFWIESGLEVMQYAREQQLPLDLVVQPQPAPDASPISMGFVDGRCKLVYSMRGNPSIEAMQPEPQLGLSPEVLVETMTAHELGHCWRHVHGLWHTPPPAVLQGPDETIDTLHRQLREMHATRREEAFGDLVALAWISARRPEHYPAVYEWLTRWRAADSESGSHHDTSTWLRGVRAASSFAASGTLFERVQSAWCEGVQEDED